MAPIFGYWKSRGLAEPIRYLLHYKGQDFEDKRYTTKEEWQTDKYKLGMDFPNLPYYIDGNVTLTQSIAILRYLSHKHGLEGRTDEAKMRVDLAEQQIIDFRNNMFRVIVSPDFGSQKEDFINGVPTQLQLFSTFLGNRPWLAGDYITYVDFLAYETFVFYQYLSTCVFNDVPNLKEYIKRFESLPEMQSYLASPNYVRWPLFGPNLYFGSAGPEPKRE